MFAYVRRLAITLPIALCVLGASQAVAGSATAPLVEPDVIAPAPIKLDLRGFYVGGDLAYAFGSGDDVGQRAPNGSLVATPGTLEPGGFNYGLRFGWRNTVPTSGLAYVYGVELGYGGGDISDSFTTATHQASIDVKNTLVLRFKGGFANTRGNMQYYGIIGYARGDIDYSVSGTAGGDTISLSDQSDYDGYLLGLGVERVLRDNLSMTLEYEYTRFNSKTLTDASGSSTVATPSYGNLRLGLNFAF
ncbi:porin family protein [Ruegeria sediminis]|uniref:Porin family protein n=1 Tax=Ruegeria sediminis TaxID=2583820 RepID=A0ABY2WXP9_9RHOB|nr:outer membrane beta-barrel protein [Ruegeria sediminis]TMV07624.1 porin family protein [Ruegeria sediminis]